VTTTTTLAGEVLATYRRTGGMAGRRFEVVVRPDGTFEGGTGRSGQGRLGSSGLDELRTAVAAFGASAPAASYGTPSPASFMTFVDAGGSSTTLLSGATPPPPVQRLVAFLAALERQLPR